MDTFTQIIMDHYCLSKKCHKIAKNSERSKAKENIHS